MPRITASEAGRIGGKIGGKSKSPAKLAACRRNGFQKVNAENSETVQAAPAGAPSLLIVPHKAED
jgi:hypothetical protein